MRYFDAARDSRDLILDHYTGVGEVLAVHELDHVFALLGRPILVKRGSLLSLDDAKNNNLIFLGSPAENLTLREIRERAELVFHWLTSGPRKGDLAILNMHPQAGEPGRVSGNPLELAPERRVFRYRPGARAKPGAVGHDSGGDDDHRHASCR